MLAITRKTMNALFALALFALALLCCGALACGPGRTTAATQPTPAAFAPEQSDAKAIEAVDKMIAAIGGGDAWQTTKQITWQQQYVLDGKLKAWFRHSWDRWNGRHRFEEADMKSYEKSMADHSDPRKTKWLIAMYDIIDHEGKGTAMFGEILPSSERDRVVAKAFEAWGSDSYRLSAHYKLKDPGVILKLDGEARNVEDTYCNPGCINVKVTFDPAVGKDTYYVSINTETNKPEIIGREAAGGRFNFAISDWKNVGELAFPTKFQNLGMKSEVFKLGNIEVGAPEDTLYIPPVR